METKEYVESLDKEIRRFAGRLRKNYLTEIEADPGFRAKVIGKLRVFLPHIDPVAKEARRSNKRRSFIPISTLQ